jgi:hypothetical protein
MTLSVLRDDPRPPWSSIPETVREGALTLGILCGKRRYVSHGSLISDLDINLWRRAYSDVLISRLRVTIDDWFPVDSETTIRAVAWKGVFIYQGNMSNGSVYAYCLASVPLGVAYASNLHSTIILEIAFALITTRDLGCCISPVADHCSRRH